MPAQPSRSDSGIADALNGAAEAVWEAHEALDRATKHLDSVGYMGLAAPLTRFQRKLKQTAEACEEDADRLVAGP